MLEIATPEVIAHMRATEAQPGYYVSCFFLVGTLVYLYSSSSYAHTHLLINYLCMAVQTPKEELDKMHVDFWNKKIEADIADLTARITATEVGLFAGRLPHCARSYLT
jgi:hypothetical protein